MVLEPTGAKTRPHESTRHCRYPTGGYSVMGAMVTVEVVMVVMVVMVVVMVHGVWCKVHGVWCMKVMVQSVLDLSVA